jgi:hypothetical protein
MVRPPFFAGVCLFLVAGSSLTIGQLIDRKSAPNTSGDGIALSLTEQVGAGRGDWFTDDSSSFIINRDPFRAIRRGRQLFQRKFTVLGGQGPLFGDGSGNVDQDRIIGAGLADSCAACHGRPRGSAGFGGDVVTRPDSRDAPHLFGLGLKEMLADEMTAELRWIRDGAVAAAVTSGQAVRRPLVAKGVAFGHITGWPDASVDVSDVAGSIPTCASALSLLMEKRSRFASSSSGPSTRRWVCRWLMLSWPRLTPATAS